MASKVSGIIEQVQPSGSSGTKYAIASTAYGYCETAAGTAIKNVDITGFKLIEGVTIHVKFANNNSAASPKLKFNSEADENAKPIVQYGTTAAGKTSETNGWYAGAVLSLTYDGTSWVRDQGFNTNSTYYFESCYSDTAADTAAKIGITSSYVLPTAGHFAFWLKNTNTSASKLTLAIKNGGTAGTAKDVWINGTVTSSTNYTWPAGFYIGYYDGTVYHFRTDGKLPGDITGNAATATNVALSGVTGADDLKAIEALSGTTGLLKKTAAKTWTLDTTSYAISEHTHNYLSMRDNIRNTSNDTYAGALSKYFSENYSTIPRGSLINFYSTTKGHGSEAFGYWIAGYNDSPYGGFFVAHYNDPRYVGINQGVYTEYKLAKINTTIVDGHILVASGTDGDIKTSGITIDDNNIITANASGHSFSNIKFYTVNASAGGASKNMWVKFAKIDLNDSNHFGNLICDIFIARSYNSPSPETYHIRVMVGWTTPLIYQLGSAVSGQIIDQFRVVQDTTNHQAFFEYHVAENASSNNTTYIKIIKYNGSDLTTMNQIQTEEDSSFSRKTSINLSNGAIVIGTGKITATEYTGNSATATQATKDGSGNVITSTYAPKASPIFTGTPKSVTPSSDSDGTMIATKAYVDGILSANNAMTFKGTLGTGGTVTTLPDSHTVGDTYRVITAGEWAGKTCVVGDLVICINTGTTASDADWTSVETNEDGAVIGPAAANSTTSNAIVRWNSTTGRVIKNSGVTIDDSNNISSVNQLNISNTGANVHLSFARTGGHDAPNYVNVPASSSLAFSVGGSGGANIIAMIDPEGIVPYTSGQKSLGTSTYQWGSVYATNFYGGGANITLGSANAAVVTDGNKKLSTRTITNSSSNTAITNNNTNIPTMNTIYYGLVVVNNASQTRATSIYAPTSAGTANHILISKGGTAAPVWTTSATLASATSTAANTAAYDVLTLGNNANVSTTTAHSEGKIVLYSAATAAHTIVGQSTTTEYTHTLPNTSGTLLDSENYSTYLTGTYGIEIIRFT